MKKGFAEADEFEKLFIDVLLYAAKNSKPTKLLFIKKCLGLMIEFEQGHEELSFNLFDYKEDFKTREYGTNEAIMNKLISYIIECRNNKAIIYYMTNKKEQAMELLMETTIMRI